MCTYRAFHGSLQHLHVFFGVKRKPQRLHVKNLFLPTSPELGSFGFIWGCVSLFTTNKNLDQQESQGTLVFRRPPEVNGVAMVCFGGVKKNTSSRLVFGGIYIIIFKKNPVNADWECFGSSGRIKNIHVNNQQAMLPVAQTGESATKIYALHVFSLAPAGKNGCLEILVSYRLNHSMINGGMLKTKPSRHPNMLTTHSANLRWIISEHHVFEKKTRGPISIIASKCGGIYSSRFRDLIGAQPSPCCEPLPRAMAAHECSQQQHSPGMFGGYTPWKTHICPKIAGFFLSRFLRCLLGICAVFQVNQPLPPQKTLENPAWVDSMSYWKWGNFRRKIPMFSEWTQWCNFLSEEPTQPNSHLKDHRASQLGYVAQIPLTYPKSSGLVQCCPSKWLLFYWLIDAGGDPHLVKLWAL